MAKVCASVMLLIMSSPILSSNIVLEETLNGDAFAGSISHIASLTGKAANIQELNFEQYTKVPLDSQFTFSRPKSSELKVASRWVKLQVNQPANKGASHKESVPVKPSDIFLVYPFSILKDEEKKISSMTIGLTAYKVEGIDKAERTGLLLKVSDDNEKLTVKASLIHTDQPKEGLTFKVEAEGNIQEEAAEVKEETQEVKEEQNQPEEMSNATNLAEEEKAEEEKIEGSTKLTQERILVGEENTFVYSGVKTLRIDMKSMTSVRFPDYKVEGNSEGIFHAEITKSVIVKMKKEGDILNIEVVPARRLI